MKEAKYRSTTWAVLWSLQQMNSAMRIEVEVAMSALPFSQSAGQEHLLFWGKKEGPKAVIWESLSEQEKTLKLAEKCKHNTRLADCRASEFSFLFFSAPLFYSFRQHYKNSAGVGHAIQCQGDFRFHDSSLFSSPSSILPPSCSFFFSIVFTKTAPVSALHQCQGDFRFHDSSLASSPSPLLSRPFPFFPYSFRQHYENSASVSATPMSCDFRFRLNHFCCLDCQNQLCVHQ